MDPSKVSIVVGPPGTGKTTDLLRTIENEIVRGTRPDEIGYVSFTRKAVEEGKSRIVERFGLSADDLIYMRTVHSMCFMMLGVRQDQMMQKNHYKEIGDRIGMELENVEIIDEDMVATAATGARIVFIENLARVTQTPLRAMWESDPETDVQWFELERYARALDQYKHSRAMLDFTDLLQMAIERRIAPKLKVLLIDEAQDLSELQWEVMEIIASRCERIYIAGDDDQAIYKWSGANVDRFINLLGTTNTLSQSHRVPRQVHGVAHEIVAQIKNRREKIWKPKAEQGVVEYVNEVDELDLGSGSWYLLARNGYMLAEYEKHCLRSGIPFDTTWGMSPMKYKSLAAIKHWETLRRGGEIDHATLKLVYGFIRQGKNRTANSTRQVSEANKNWLFSMRSLTENFGLLSDKVWFETLDGISPTEREFYLAARRRGESLKDKPRVRISTIHRVKGGEADHVFLATDISARTFNEMERNPDDEGRVFYVGATRAIKSLHVRMPSSQMFYNI